MSNDELEFLISQHLDGDISPADEVRLQAFLVADAAARELFAEHREIHAALVESRDLPELGSVDFASLRAGINAAIDDANSQTIKLHHHPAWGGRVLRYGSIAVAAMVAIAIGTAAFLNRGDAPKPLADKPTDPANPVLVANSGTPTGVDNREGTNNDRRINIQVGPLGAGGLSVAQVFGPEAQSSRSPTVASVTLGQPVGIPESALLNLLVAERMPKRVVVAPGKR